MMPKNRKPTHPGEILLEEFLRPMKLSQLELLDEWAVPIQRVNTPHLMESVIWTAETAILLLASTQDLFLNSG